MSISLCVNYKVSHKLICFCVKPPIAGQVKSEEWRIIVSLRSKWAQSLNIIEKIVILWYNQKKQYLG